MERGIYPSDSFWFRNVIAINCVRLHCAITTGDEERTFLVYVIAHLGRIEKIFSHPMNIPCKCTELYLYHRCADAILLTFNNDNISVWNNRWTFLRFVLRTCVVSHYQDAIKCCQRMSTSCDHVHLIISTVPTL